MKQIKNWNDLDYENIEFLHDAHNVYRTSDFIVKQQITSSFNEETMIATLVSYDTYYARTERRDAEYNFIFAERGKKINGKRIRTGMFTRKYVD